MLSTLITTLQNALQPSRSYLFGSFLPVLLAFLSSVAVAATSFAGARKLLYQLVQEKPIAATSWVLLLLVVFAYIFSVIVGPLRRVLEDFPLLRNPLLRRQIRLAEEARRQLNLYQCQYAELVEAGWIARLRDARNLGKQTVTDDKAPRRDGLDLSNVEAALLSSLQECLKERALHPKQAKDGDASKVKAADAALEPILSALQSRLEASTKGQAGGGPKLGLLQPFLDKGWANSDETLGSLCEDAAAFHDMRAKLEELKERKSRLADLTPSDLSPALAQLRALLANGWVNGCAVLGSLHEEAVDLVQYVERRLQTKRLRAFERYASFPDCIAPTRMGNLAGTLRSYAQTRYGMPLDILWTRFQRVLQDDEKLNGTLQDAKIQLDFLVSLTWLTAAFTLVWTAVLAVYSRSYGAFLVVSLLGPLCVGLFYWLACQAYLTFSEVMCGAVDLRRFDLLTALKQPLPSFPEQEKDRWGALSQWVGYGSTPDGTFFRHKS